MPGNCSADGRKIHARCFWCGERAVQRCETRPGLVV